MVALSYISLLHGVELRVCIGVLILVAVLVFLVVVVLHLFDLLLFAYSLVGYRVQRRPVREVLAWFLCCGFGQALSILSRQFLLPFLQLFRRLALSFADRLKVLRHTLHVFLILRTLLLLLRQDVVHFV